MSEFKRENRYIVIKRKHLDLLTEKSKEELENILTAISIARMKNIDTGVDDIECVVVESDWPEYEKVWRMIELRIKGMDETGEYWRMRTKPNAIIN